MMNLAPGHNCFQTIPLKVMNTKRIVNKFKNVIQFIILRYFAHSGCGYKLKESGLKFFFYSGGLRVNKTEFKS